MLDGRRLNAEADRIGPAYEEVEGEAPGAQTTRKIRKGTAAAWWETGAEGGREGGRPGDSVTRLC